MRKKISLSVPALAMMGCLGLAACNAVAVTVPNFSFENPPGPYPLQISLTIDDWSTTGPPSEVVDIGAGPQNAGVGIFQNTAPGTPGFPSNANGENLAYMFSGSQDPTYNLHTLSQVLPTPFSANTPYTLTVGVADASAPPTQGDQLSIQLFYMTAATPGHPSTAVLLGTPTNVVQGPPVVNSGGILFGGSTPLSTEKLTPYSFSLPALAQNDPAVTSGSGIGIIFTTSGVGGGEFNLDDVILTPEPGSLALFSLASAGLLRRRRAIH